MCVKQSPISPGTSKTLGLVACFAAAVLPVNYLALDFAIVLPNLHPTAVPRLQSPKGGSFQRRWWGLGESTRFFFGAGTSVCLGFICSKGTRVNGVLG